MPNRTRPLLVVAALTLAPAAASHALDTSVAAVHGQSSRAKLGDGTGVTVGIIDSGVDATHPALAGNTSQGLPRLKAQANFVPAEPASTGDDVFGHGTWVASAILGADPVFAGMAPDARYVNARVLDNNNGFASGTQVRNGLGFAIAQGADVVNLSLNFFAPNSAGTDPLDLMLDWAAFDRGVVPVVIAGNISQAQGGATRVRSPASAYNGLTVGRTTNRPLYDRVNTDSATATTADGRSKPDLVAPGTGLTLANDDWEGAANDWDANLGGTSFAAPHVAGLAAQQIEYGRAHNLTTHPLVIKATQMASATRVLDKTGAPWAHRASSVVAGVHTITAPLDPDSGAGQIDGDHLFRVYSAGPHAPAAAPAPVGWDLATATGTASLEYDLGTLLGGTTLTATLTWLRHVTRTDNGNGIIDAADTFAVAQALDNLDLTLLAGGNPVMTSASAIDNVEHVVFDVPASAAYALRVSRLAVAGSGADEQFALAWSATPVPEPAAAAALALLPALAARTHNRRRRRPR